MSSSSLVCPLAWTVDDVVSWAYDQGGDARLARGLREAGVRGVDLYCRPGHDHPSIINLLFGSGDNNWWSLLSSTLPRQALSDLQASVGPACQLDGYRWWPGRYCLLQGGLEWTALILYLPAWLLMALQLTLPLAFAALGRRLWRLAIKNEASDLLALSTAYLSSSLLVTLNIVAPSLASPLLIYLPLLLAPLAMLRVTFGVYRLGLLAYCLIAMLPSLVVLSLQQQQQEQQQQQSHGMYDGQHYYYHHS